MNGGRIILERDGSVWTIRLDDPATLNALTIGMVEQLKSLLQAAEHEARAVVIAGSDQAFCSGANLGAAEGPSIDAVNDAGLGLETAFNPLMEKIRNLRVPLVTAVNGVAAGGGAAIALAGDIIVAGSGARFFHAFAKIGLVPDCGTASLLVQAVGRVRAMELIMLGEPLAAGRALEWGLVNRVVADQQVEATARALASRLAGGPATALSMSRRLVWTALERGFAEMLRLERSLQQEAGNHPDFGEGVRAFRERRPPRFHED